MRCGLSSEVASERGKGRPFFIQRFISLSLSLWVGGLVQLVGVPPTRSSLAVGNLGGFLSGQHLWQWQRLQHPWPVLTSPASVHLPASSLIILSHFPPPNLFSKLYNPTSAALLLLLINLLGLLLLLWPALERFLPFLFPFLVI